MRRERAPERSRHQQQEKAMSKKRRSGKHAPDKAHTECYNTVRGWMRAPADADAKED